MPRETIPGLTAHFAGTVPMQVVGSTKSGQETIIGTFQGGVVLDGTTLLDVISREIICSYSMRDNSWVVTKRNVKRYKYIFLQTQPQE